LQKEYLYAYFFKIILLSRIDSVQLEIKNSSTIFIYNSIKNSMNIQYHYENKGYF